MWSKHTIQFHSWRLLNRLWQFLIVRQEYDKILNIFGGKLFKIQSFGGKMFKIQNFGGKMLTNSSKTDQRLSRVSLVSIGATSLRQKSFSFQIHCRSSGVGSRLKISWWMDHLPILNREVEYLQTDRCFLKCVAWSLFPVKRPRIQLKFVAAAVEIWASQGNLHIQ